MTEIVPCLFCERLCTKKGSVFEMNQDALIPCCVAPQCNKMMSVRDADDLGACVAELTVLQNRLEDIEFINSHFKCCFCLEWHGNEDVYLWSRCGHKYTKSCIRECLNQCIQQ
eukprot:77531_1